MDIGPHEPLGVHEGHIYQEVHFQKLASRKNLALSFHIYIFQEFVALLAMLSLGLYQLRGWNLLSSIIKLNWKN